MHPLTWVEISRPALRHNISQLRGIMARDSLLCACVKANAYGHGLLEAAGIFLEAGADWLSVNALYEARALRQAGISAPIYILGYVPLEDVREALELDARLVVYNFETINMISEAARASGKSARVHLKVETGTNRQGISLKDLADFAAYLQGCAGLVIEGLSTHFANIEDTTDHAYAERQMERFRRAAAQLEAAGIAIPIKHCANSAATILFPETHFQMVRPGIAAYGMWPSKETHVAYTKERGNHFAPLPALTWKTRIAQIKTVPAGEHIGYGCTFRTGHATRLAILPVGYYDGYDRGLAGGHVLIHGKQAPVRGRICMNIVMVEVTDIPEARLEDEAVLLGRQGDESISAEQFAAWAGTINYEVTTRINERIPRLIVD